MGSLGACGSQSKGDKPSDLTARPASGDCRDLKPTDLREPANDSPVVDCSKEHTAQTFYVGTFEGGTVGPTPIDSDLAPLAYTACEQAFMDYLGADDSLAMRSTLTWAWFRPSNLGWER